MKTDLLLGGLVVGSLVAVTFWPRSTPAEGSSAPAVVEDPGSELGGDPDQADRQRTVTLRVEGPDRALVRGPEGEELGRTDDQGRVRILLPRSLDAPLSVHAEGYLTSVVRARDLRAAIANPDQELRVTLAPETTDTPEPQTPPTEGIAVLVHGPEGPLDGCLFEVRRSGKRLRAGRLDAQGRTLLPVELQGPAAGEEGEATWLLLRPRDLSLAVRRVQERAEATWEISLDQGGTVTFHMPGIRRQPAVFQGLEVVDKESGILLAVVPPTVDDRYRVPYLPLDRPLLLRRPGRDEFVQSIRDDLQLSAENRSVDLGEIAFENDAEGSP